MGPRRPHLCQLGACCKSELRSPKSEGRIPEDRKKAEIRKRKNDERASIRISAFGLLSGFGPRISAFAVASEPDRALVFGRLETAASLLCPLMNTLPNFPRVHSRSQRM